MSDKPTRDNSPRSANSSPPAPAQTEADQSGLLPPDHWTQRQEEANENDDDSAFGDNASSTASLSSSVLQYRTIQGRTYHSERGDANYWGPVDDVQQEALDINHHVLTLLLGGELYLAPLAKDAVHAALDIGTGTGIWAIDFADRFPNASVIGTDIAPIQPSWIPPNLQFQIDDCTQDWTFQENSLDYIHTRWLVGSIADWGSLFQQAYKCLKPGGYLETHEPSSRFESDDGSVTETSALTQWGKFFVEGGRKLGRPFTVFEDGLQRKAMEEAGFVDIEERDFRNPVGRWPREDTAREIGAYSQLAFEQDAEGAVLFMATTLGWKKEEVTVFLSYFRREIRSYNIHAYYRQKVVWGRKPLTS